MSASQQLDRTTELGLFNYARSFWEAGSYLINVHPKNARHPHAPITMLLCQAIELYLKSFLRVRGYSLEQLANLGHRYKALAKRAKTNGLAIADRDEQIIAFLADEEAFIQSLYIQTGRKRMLDYVPASARGHGDSLA